MKKKTITRISNFWGEEILDVAANIVLDNVSEKFKEQFDEISSKKLDSLIKMVPEFAEKIKEGKTYKVIFTKGIGKLQESKDMPGLFLAHMVDEKTNKIVEVGKLQQVGNLPAVTNGVFSVMSAVTAQHYLEDIDQKLSLISSNIDKIKNFLKDDKRSKLESYEHYFKNVSKNLESILLNETQKTTVLNELQRSQNDIYSDIQFYKKQFNRDPYSKAEDRKLSAVENKTMEAQEYLAAYKYSVTLYVYNKFIETMLLQITDENQLNNTLNDLKSVLANHEEDFKKWQEMYNEYLNRVGAFKESTLIKFAKEFKNVNFGPMSKYGVAIFLKAGGYAADKLSEVQQQKKDTQKEQLVCEINSLFCDSTEQLKILSTNIENYTKMMNEEVEVMIHNGKAYLNYK